MSPSEETDGAVLGDEGDANTGVEAAEVRGHLREGEIGAVDIFPRTSVFNLRCSSIVIEVLLGEDGREEPVNN